MIRPARSAPRLGPGPLRAGIAALPVRALTTHSPAAHLVSFGACLVLLGFVMGAPLVGQGTPVFGNAGDARLNAYLLEHLFRWLRGDDLLLLSPGMFYPYPDALFFGDNHLLTVAFYAPWRLLGFSEAESFNLWVLGAEAACLASAYFVAWRLGLPAASAAVMAVAFALALPSFPYLNQAQLCFRFAVPLAFYCAWRGISGRSVTLLAAAAFWLAVQLLASVYVGVFLALMLAPAALYTAIRERRGLVRGLAEDARLAWRDRRVALVAALALGLLAVGLAALNLATYAAVASVHNPSRNFESMIKWTPRPESYLRLEALPYWLWLAGRTPIAVHGSFVGLGVAIPFLVGLVAILRRRDGGPEYGFAAALLFATAVAFASTVYVFSDSLWRLIVMLPGLGAIRIPARVILVMAFPISLVAAIGFDRLAGSLRAPAVVAGFGIALAGLAIFELVSVSKPTFRWTREDANVEAIAEKARALRGDIADPILFLWPDTTRPGHFSALDGARAGLKLGWPSVNGYAGIGPRGFDTRRCDALRRIYGTYAEWAGLPVEETRSALLARTVTVYPRDAGSADLPSEEAASKVRLGLAGLQPVGRGLTVTLRIRNGWGEPLPRAAANPLRVAWRFVPSGAHLAAGEGWRGFVPIRRDIAPCSSARMPVEVPLPSVPGTYSLEFTLSSEGRFLLHEKGMRILRLPNQIVVE